MSCGRIVTMMTSSCSFRILAEIQEPGGNFGAVGAENDAMVIAPDLRWNAVGARSHALAITLDVPEDTDIYGAHGSLGSASADRDRCAGNGIYFASRAKFRDNLEGSHEAPKNRVFDKELPSRVMTAKSNNNKFALFVIRGRSFYTVKVSERPDHRSRNTVVLVNGVLHVQKASQK